MGMPGFTAEVSLHKTTQSHIAMATFQASQPSTNLYPQRVSGPSGPIGLPGQDCYGACLHICMTFGGGSGCLVSCMSTCTGSPGGLAGLI